MDELHTPAISGLYCLVGGLVDREEGIGVAGVLAGSEEDGGL